jgi:hypothetical protein
MTVASVHSVERTVHKTNEWLKDLDAELGIEDRDDAWWRFDPRRSERTDASVIRSRFGRSNEGDAEGTDGRDAKSTSGPGTRAVENQ